MTRWSERVAPGVAIMRHRAKHKLAYVTLENELDAAATLIEEMADRLDRARVRVALGSWLALLVVLVAIFGTR